MVYRVKKYWSIALTVGAVLLPVNALSATEDKTVADVVESILLKDIPGFILPGYGKLKSIGLSGKERSLEDIPSGYVLSVEKDIVVLADQSVVGWRSSTGKCLITLRPGHKSDKDRVLRKGVKLTIVGVTAKKEKRADADQKIIFIAVSHPKIQHISLTIVNNEEQEEESERHDFNPIKKVADLEGPECGRAFKMDYSSLPDL